MSIVEIFVDGALRANNLPRSWRLSGAAVVVYINHRRRGEFARLLSVQTNNQAEYEALLSGLTIAWGSGLADPIIYSDSQLVVNQVNGVWKCANPTLAPYLFSIQQIARQYRFRLIKVPRHKVSEADGLVNLVMDEYVKSPGYVNLKPPDVVSPIPPPPI